VIRYRRGMTPDEELDALLDGLDARQVAGLLRHPAWPARCDCGEFGFPFDVPLLIKDWYTVHGASVCQPSREYLDP
jgi:hypothetical protein